MMPFNSILSQLELITCQRVPQISSNSFIERYMYLNTLFTLLHAPAFRYTKGKLEGKENDTL